MNERLKPADDFASRIKARVYQSPSRARAAVSRSHLTARQKVRLTELCDVWEGELTNGATVGGPPAEGTVEPEEHQPELVAGRRHGGVHLIQLEGAMVPVDERGPRVNLNTRVRAQLNAHGVSVLYAARRDVIIPPDLISNQGVWITQLWEFMRVMGPAFHVGEDPVTVDNAIELLPVEG